MYPEDVPAEQAAAISAEGFGSDSSTLSNADLDDARGAAGGTRVITRQSSVLSGNTLSGDISSGDNSISSGSLAGATGNFVVMQNSGAQVNMSSSFTANITFIENPIQ